MHVTLNSDRFYYSTQWTGGQFLVFKTVTTWNHRLSYMLSVLFIVCFYTQQMTQNSSIYLLWQFHGFEYQMKNLWIHFWWFSFQCFDFSWGIYCSSVSRGDLCTSWSSFLKTQRMKSKMPRKALIHKVSTQLLFSVISQTTSEIWGH